MASHRARRPTAGPQSIGATEAIRALGALVGIGLLAVLAGCSGESEAAGPERVGLELSGDAISEARPDLDGQGPAAAPATEVARRLPAPRRLEAEVEAIVADGVRCASRRSKGVANTGTVHVGVHALVAGRGELVARSSDRSMRPASNLKLVTSAALLFLIGAGSEFVTPVDARGTLERGVLQGDLVVHASGDPFCRADGNAAVESRFDDLARELRDRGLQRVRGDLVLDEGTFLEPAPGPAWPDPSQHWAEYCALAAGFTVNGGVLQAVVTPRDVGQEARVAVHPAPHGLPTRYGVQTSRRRHDVRVGATRSAVTVRGDLPTGVDPFVAEFAHPDPRELFASVLVAALERAGIRIEGGVRFERGTPRGRVLAALRSPVDDVLGPINADSRNSVADQVFLSLGQAVSGEGTRLGGRRATALALRRLGVPVEGLVQVDGSGLSFDNRVCPRQITALLESVLGHAGTREAELYRRSLAIGGETGTLKGRLARSPARGHVYAKSGWIRGTSSLSGLVERADGERVLFSILIEYPPQLDGLNTHCFKPMQDELVTLFFGASL